MQSPHAQPDLLLAQDHYSKRPAVLAICGAVRHSRGRYSGHCQVLHDDKLPRGLGPLLYIHFWLLCSLLAQDHYSKRPAVLAICGAVRHSRGRHSGHCQVLHDDKLPRGLGPLLYIHFWLLCSAHAAAPKATNSDSTKATNSDSANATNSDSAKAAKTHAPPAFPALFR